MSNAILVSSYYTKGTLYEKECQNLINSCEKHSIEYDIVGKENLGSWNANCHMKPEFILNQVQKHQRPILWLDADAVVLQPLEYFSLINDSFMVRIRNDVEYSHFDKIITSTLYVKNDPIGIEILEKWCEESLKRRDELCDQECLKEAIIRHKLQDNVKPIPVKYCTIQGLDEEKVDRESVAIIQYQASRLLRKIVDGEVAQFPFLEGLAPDQLQSIRYSYE